MGRALTKSSAGGRWERRVALGVTAIRERLVEGVLAFPATPFAPDGTLDRDGLTAHVAHIASHSPLALVPAGGAGELFSLSLAEHEAVVRATVEGAGGLPVVAGVGGGIGIAVEMARAAERAGADAILLLPPYLTAAEQEGLRGFVETVCRSVGIGVIAYSRNNGILSADTVLRLAEACPTFVGLKDGTGDFETLSALVSSLGPRAGDRLALVNGVPTAEMLARQCWALGIRAYSSAVFSFAPALARAFFEAVREGDAATTDGLLTRLYLPLVALRNRRRGYAVSLVKGGLDAVGRPAGPVRPPLQDLRPAEVEEIAGLVRDAEAFLAGRAAPAEHAAAAQHAGRTMPARRA